VHADAKTAPLEGIKVLEMGSLIAGPYASALLAQFGAEVIKIEPPREGDPLRQWRKVHSGTLPRASGLRGQRRSTL
jgi:formyl-CoA transferase